MDEILEARQPNFREFQLMKTIVEHRVGIIYNKHIKPVLKQYPETQV